MVMVHVRCRPAGVVRGLVVPRAAKAETGLDVCIMMMMVMMTMMMMMMRLMMILIRLVGWGDSRWLPSGGADGGSGGVPSYQGRDQSGGLCEASGDDGDGDDDDGDDGDDDDD
jgi:hypothetical protein